MNKFPLKWSEVLAVGGWAGVIFSVVSAFKAPPVHSALFSLVTFFFGVILWALSRWWSDRTNRFILGACRKGQVAYENFADAQTVILVTHFTSAIPKASYVDKMIERMDEEGATVSRIVGTKIGSTNPAWLRRFRANQRYVEYHSDANLPFDFLVVDDRRVVLALPSDPRDLEFGKALIFDNAEVAKVFRWVFETMLAKSRLYTSKNEEPIGFPTTT